MKFDISDSYKICGGRSTFICTDVIEAASPFRILRYKEATLKLYTATRITHHFLDLFCGFLQVSLNISCYVTLMFGSLTNNEI
jgi:hypothetical protein